MEKKHSQGKPQGWLEQDEENKREEIEEIWDFVLTGRALQRALWMDVKRWRRIGNGDRREPMWRSMELEFTDHLLTKKGSPLF